MEEHVRAYARLRLEMAREELDTARENIAHGRFRAAVSRAYYKDVVDLRVAGLITEDEFQQKRNDILRGV